MRRGRCLRKCLHKGPQEFELRGGEEEKQSKRKQQQIESEEGEAED